MTNLDSPGVTIYADLNGNGALDRNEPSTVTMRDDPDTAFDEAGMYWLEGLDPGRYFIREVVPDGFEQTFPASSAAGSRRWRRRRGVRNGLTIGHRSRPRRRRRRSRRRFDHHRSVLLPSVRRRRRGAGCSQPAWSRTSPASSSTAAAGDVSEFSIRFGGDGNEHSFALQFVDAEFGGTLAEIPVRIGGGTPQDAHFVVLETGQTVEGLDFGNRPLPGGSGMLPGDCNRDGANNIADPICLVRFLFAGQPPRLPCGDGTVEDPAVLAMFDFNGDNGINITDVIGQISFQFAGGPGHVLGEDCVTIRTCPEVCGQ